MLLCNHFQNVDNNKLLYLFSWQHKPFKAGLPTYIKKILLNKVFYDIKYSIHIYSTNKWFP